MSRALKRQCITKWIRQTKKPLRGLVRECLKILPNARGLILRGFSGKGNIKTRPRGKGGLKMEEREIDFFEKKARGVVEQVLSLADYIGTFTPRQKKAVEHFVKMGFWEGVNAEVSANVDFKKEP